MCVPLGSCCFCIGLEIGTKVISIGSTVCLSLIALLYATAAWLPALAQSKRLFYGAVAAVASVHAVAGMLLIYAAFWKKPRCMWPWLLLSWTTSAVLLCAGVGGIALMHLAQVDEDLSFVVSAYVVYSVVTYFLALVVNSHRAELSQGQLYSAVKGWNPPAGAWNYTRPYSTWRYV